MLNPIKINGIVIEHTKHSTKRKIFSVLLSILLIWVTITLYFYCQHIQKVKFIPLYENIQIGDTKVCLRELSLVNYKPRPFDFTNPPWYIELSKRLPQSLIMPYYKMIAFYRSPYTVNAEHGIATLSGYVLSKDGERLFGYPDKKIDIWLAGDYEVGYPGGTGTRNLGWDHFSFFHIEGNNVPLATQELSIMINDKVNNKDYKLPIKLDWQTKTYTFFNRKPSYGQAFDPAEKVKEFIDLQNQGAKEKLEQLILSDRLATIPWQYTKYDDWQLLNREENVSYQEKYQGLSDVITVTITFGEFIEGSFKGKARQQFYLIDHQGTWKIIDIGPAQKIN